MAKSRASNPKRAAAHNKEGLQAYADWEVDKAAAQFRSATRLAPNKSEYHLNLAKALARGGNFDQALQAIAEFMRLEPDSELADRFVQLFASGLDKVESILTEKMTGAGIPLEQIGAAMQMWLEYRIAAGRTPLSMRKPETWAAGLDYTVRKVNLHRATQREVAALYGVSVRILRERFDNLVATLDVMPCDYRYFVGQQNPLDKLVEAAEILEKLEASFREP